MILVPACSLLVSFSLREERRGGGMHASEHPAGHASMPIELKFLGQCGFPRFHRLGMAHRPF